MRIFHVMLSKNLGGIEFSYVLYTKALLKLGYEVICIVRPGAKIIPSLPKEVSIFTLPNIAKWDPYSVWRARDFIKNYAPDMIISHGKRAGTIFLRACDKYKNISHVKVLHRYRLEETEHYHGIICVNRDLQQKLLKRGTDPKRVFYLPNFIEDCSLETNLTPINNPPCIGYIGRFVPEKGVDLLIKALSILYLKRIPFKAILAGDGPEKKKLEGIVSASPFQKYVKFLGWLDDKKQFYNEIDILCVPSRIETFGIVILEALNLGKPVISTKTPGPKDIITHNKNGVLCEVDSNSISDSIQNLIENPNLAFRLATQGRQDVKHYMMASILPKLNDILTICIENTSSIPF